MDEVARKIRRVLEAEAEESLLGVGYYSAEETEPIYLSERVKEQYSEEEVEAVLESAFFESFGGRKQEELHSAELHATTRTFDRMLDTVIPISETEGVVFALDRDGAYSYRRLITLIETVVAEEKLGAELEKP